MRAGLVKDKIVYYSIRLATLPFSWMPFSWIRWIGKKAGWVAFYFMETYRKRTLSNLALAKDLALSPKELIATAKQSFQNLAINCLEYPKLACKRDLSRAIRCENPDEAEALYQKGYGIIFFCGHQANWEVLFLDGTTRMKGVAIGKSIKNKLLYNWILQIREKNGGKIISQRNAVREGLRALRKGIFLGIVGDQGMPDSGYSFPFFGRRAWTSTAPALLAYKTQSPILFAETRRVPGGYRIHYSDPIWPDLSEPLEKEVVRMMDASLALLEKSIKNSPGEWLWQHNRWKQQTPQIVYKRFRHDCICIILPEEKTAFEEAARHLPALKLIYPLSFISLLIPTKYVSFPLIDADETIPYACLADAHLPDYRFKLVFNFTDCLTLKRHYKKYSAFEVLSLSDLKQLAAPHLSPEIENNFSEIFKRALCRSGTLWNK